MELATKEVSFTRVLHSLKSGGVYAVPEGSYNLAGVWVSCREMYFSVDHSGKIPSRAGWWCRLFSPCVVGQELGRETGASVCSRSRWWTEKQNLQGKAGMSKRDEVALEKNNKGQTHPAPMLWFSFPSPACAQPSWMSIPPNNQARALFQERGTSLGASAAGVTSPTTPQLSAVPAKALLISPLQVPQNQQGWGLSADSTPGKIIQAARPEFTIRYSICF